MESAKGVQQQLMRRTWVDCHWMVKDEEKVEEVEDGSLLEQVRK